MLLIGIQTVRRLVQDQIIRVMDDRLSETGAVLIPFGESIHCLVRHRLQETGLDRVLHRLFAVGSAQSAQLRRETQKTINRHIRV